MAKIDFSKHEFHPVVRLPKEYVVYDLTSGKEGHEFSQGYSVGRYNEKRPGVYNTALFGGVRNVHMGIDIGCPVGTEVFAPYPGRLFLQGYNEAPGDYGGTVITEHEFDGVKLYMLYGHLSRASLKVHAIGEKVLAGTCVGWIGDRSENGGWNPHVHFQLSWVAPLKPDMPGVVSEEDRPKALETYPDPRLVLGPIY